MGYLIKMNRVLIKKLVIFIFIAMLFSVSFVHATYNNKLSFREIYNKKIDFETANKIANCKLIELDKSNFYFIENYDMIIDDDTDKVLFYIFYLNPQGFIVITSNYELPPIIAYSFNNNFFSFQGSLFAHLKTFPI